MATRYKITLEFTDIQQPPLTPQEMDELLREIASEDSLPIEADLTTKWEIVS